MCSDEAERCALLAEDLAGRWETSAAKALKDGEYNTGWPGYRTFVKLREQQLHDSLCQAASNLRAVARGCRAGWDPRK